MIALLWIAPALAGDPDEALAEGRRRLAVRDGPGAEAVLQACVDERPEAAGCWWELGWSHWIQREWPNTVRCWERVRELDPGHPDVRSALSKARDNLALAELAQQGALQAPPSFAAAPEGAALRVRAVGDVMLGSSFPDGFLPPDDGRASLAAVDGLLADADLTFANLEGPLCDVGATTKCDPRKPPGSCYAFKSPTRYGAYLDAAGIDVVSTANNHAGDFGDLCRAETERTLDALGIAHSGRPGDVASLDARGLRIAIVAFHASAATHDVRDVPTARTLVRGLAASHDVVIVSFHGGAEGAKALHVPQGPEIYLDEDRGDLRAFAHAVVEEGADLVIGHGPHVLRGMEVHDGRLIAYSLGNFATYGRFNLSGNLGVGAVLEVTLDREGAFLGGRLLSTRQEGEGIAVPDEAGRAVDLVRQLSAEDFPGTAVQVARDGSLAAPAR